jgi:hypothetical protein
MIVSERFVWAHIPKTGGDATAMMIQRVPRLVVLADPLGDNAKHLPFDQRQESIAGKLLVANIRRLPSWAVSYARHVERFGSWPDYRPTGPRDPEMVAAEAAADWMLDGIVGEYDVDVWLRQEHLADDLVRFLREVAGLTPAEEAAVRAVGRVNDQRPRFRVWRRPSPRRFFTPAQIETLYAANPRWASIERATYG